MKAAYIEKNGPASTIKIGQLPIPELKSDEILVKVKAVSVNFVDTFVRAGSFKTKQDFPFVIGRDAVGTVSAIGRDVSQFKTDDLVWTNSMGYDGRMGTSSELVAVPEARLFHAPKVDPIKLVASVHSSATAAIVLSDVLQVESNHRILIEGGAGHVGTKFIELAKSLGLEVATTSNSNDFEKLQQLGTDKTLDYHEPIQGNYDYIVDTSGKVSLQNNLDHLNLYGKIALITAPKDNQFDFQVRQMYTKSQSINGFVISHATLKQIQSAGKILNDNFEAGRLLTDEILTMPLDQAAKAQQLLENHQTKNQRIVLTVE